MSNELELFSGEHTIVKPTTIGIKVLDASGSMNEYGSVPQDETNRLISHLRDEEGEQAFWCAVVTFANNAKLNVPLTPVGEITPMTNYYASGETLLYVTVDRVFKELRRLLEGLPRDLREQVTVVVSVFSDGGDNKSPKPLYPEKLQEASQRALEDGWGLFAYGIGISGEGLARKMGFPVDETHAVTVPATREGVARSMHTSSVHTSTFHTTARKKDTPSDEHAVR